MLGEEVARRLGHPGVRPVVVALPRGGLPVGAEVARRLGADLMVMPVGKVGAPGHEELAVGAVAPGGVTVLTQGVIAALRLAPDELEQLVRRTAEKVARQEKAYQAGRRPSIRPRRWSRPRRWRRRPSIRTRTRRLPGRPRRSWAVAP